MNVGNGSRYTSLSSYKYPGEVAFDDIVRPRVPSFKASHSVFDFPGKLPALFDVVLIFVRQTPAEVLPILYGSGQEVNAGPIQSE
jgi:hypothetical protein